MSALAVTLGGLWLSAAEADVRAFRVTTGAEDTAFVTLDQSTIPYMVVPDDAGGVYVFGRVWVGGKNLKFVHVLPDGNVDPRFHASVDNGSVISAVARGNDLALLGTCAGDQQL